MNRRFLRRLDNARQLLACGSILACCSLVLTSLVLAVYTACICRYADCVYNLCICLLSVRAFHLESKIMFTLRSADIYCERNYYKGRRDVIADLIKGTMEVEGSGDYNQEAKDEDKDA